MRAAGELAALLAQVDPQLEITTEGADEVLLRREDGHRRFMEPDETRPGYVQTLRVP